MCVFVTTYVHIYDTPTKEKKCTPGVRFVFLRQNFVLLVDLTASHPVTVISAKTGMGVPIFRNMIPKILFLACNWQNNFFMWINTYTQNCAPGVRFVVLHQMLFCRLLWQRTARAPQWQSQRRQVRVCFCNAMCPYLWLDKKMCSRCPFYFFAPNFVVCCFDSDLTVGRIHSNVKRLCHCNTMCPY